MHIFILVIENILIFSLPFYFHSLFIIWYLLFFLQLVRNTIIPQSAFRTFTGFSRNRKLFQSQSGFDSFILNTDFSVDLVESVQKFGERPTAAFPSSHVGISTLILLLLIRGRHYSAFTITFPLYLILVFATIYIQAHYVVD